MSYKKILKNKNFKCIDSISLNLDLIQFKCEKFKISLMTNFQIASPNL